MGDEPLQLVVGQVKILARRAIGVSRATMPSANVGPMALFETTRPNPGPSAAGAVIAVGAAADGDDIAPFAMVMPTVAYRMFAWSMVALAPAPTSLMPPQSPAGKGNGGEHTCTKTEQPASMPAVLSRKLVKVFEPVSLASNVTSLRFRLPPLALSTLPPGTLKTPPDMFRLPLST